MTSRLTAEAIIFAINSALKLGRNIRKAYAHSLKSKEIVLPLPKFNGEPNLLDANDFFDDTNLNTGGARFISQIPRLETLYKEKDSGLHEEPLKEYLDFYKTLSVSVDDKNRFEKGYQAQDVVALLKIQQWEKGNEPEISSLKIMAGTLVEIGIDYFTQVPGALNTDTAHGKILKNFLMGFDNIPFSEPGAFKEVGKLIIPKLFITAAEVIGELSPQITSDIKLQKFIRVTSHNIAKDLFERVKNAGSEREKREAIRWGQTVLYSLVKNAGDYVFASPGNLFRVNEAESNLIKETGQAFLQIILDEKVEKVDFKEAFNVESLDKVIRAALKVVAEYPGLIAKQDGIKNIVIDVSKAIAKDGIQRPDLIPELVRLILESTAGNLNLLWPVKHTDAKHLLVTALQQILAAISIKPKSVESDPNLPVPKWRPRLSKAQILAICNTLFDEVVHNPEWVTKKIDENSNPLLQEVLESVFTALQQVPFADRLNFHTVEIVIQVSLRTTATSQIILKKIHWAEEEEERTILNKALDLIFAFVFDPKQKTNTDQIDLLVDLLDYILEVIIAHNPNQNGLILTNMILFESGIDYSNGFNRDLVDQVIASTLSILSEHPELAAHDEVLQQIIGDVAKILKETNLHQPALLPEILRIILASTAQNAALVIKAEDGTPKYLLVIAIREILLALSQKPTNDDRWHPKLTGAQALFIAESLLEEVVLNPSWITDQVDGKDHPVLKEVLEAIFSALAKIPQEERLSLETLEWLIRISLNVVVNSPKVLQEIHWTTDNEERVVLNKALELVFACVFKTPNNVNKPELLADLTEYALEAIISKHPDEKGLILLDIVLFPDSGIDYSNGFNQDLADAILDAALKALSEHPELVTDQEALKNIIQGVATALKSSNIKKSDLLPELVRLTLFYTAGNLDIVIKTKRGKTSYLLVIALEQILSQLAQKPRRGKWKPVLTEEQILETIELVLQEVIENPEWVNRDKLLVKVLRATFRALEIIPSESKLAYITFRILLEEVLKAVSIRRNLVIKFVDDDGSTNQLILSYTLEGFFVSLYGPNNQSAGTWALTKTNMLNEVIEHYLKRISEGALNKEAIDETLKIIEKAVLDINNNLPFTLDGLLAKLENRQAA